MNEKQQTNMNEKQTNIDPSEIGQQFDSISYDKGASLLFMLRNYLAEKDSNAFSNGLVRYLKTYEYG